MSLLPSNDLHRSAHNSLGRSASVISSVSSIRSLVATPTWIVDGDRDELIKREDTDRMESLIPDAGELILPPVSHFALLQDPAEFNGALLHFLSRH